MLLRDDRGPYLLIALDELERVSERLLELGVAFWQDEDGTTCGGPVFGRLRFEDGVDESRIGRAIERDGH